MHNKTGEPYNMLMQLEYINEFKPESKLELM